MTIKAINWLPIPEYEEIYQVSSDGQIRSADRHVKRAGTLVRRKGQTLSPTRQEPSGHLWVWLSQDGKKKKKYVHRLVALAFVGPCPEGMEVRHLDGDPLNNSVHNLSYGTRSENMWDRAEHGRHPNKRKTHCVRGHEFSEENTYTRVYPSRPEYKDHRDCRACAREKYQERKLSV